MKIHGLQKMTLLDYPGRVACTLFTAGCNFRCPFCHNAALVTNISDPIFSEEEILSFLTKRKGLLEGVCITGGEPLLNPDIAAFIAKIKAIGYSVKVDSNGSFPDRLEELIDAGLADYVAMDIKNCAEKYPMTAGTDETVLPAIEKSIDLLLRNRVPYEFRTTVFEPFHTVDDIEKIARRICGAKRYFIQPFVDSGELIGKETMTAPNENVLREMVKTAKNFVPNAQLRGI